MVDHEWTKTSAKRTIHYGWIIAGITFLTLLVSAGIRSTPGVLIMPLEMHFGWDRTITTFPIAINLALYGLCGPFAAALMERFGIQTNHDCRFVDVNDGHWTLRMDAISMAIHSVVGIGGRNWNRIHLFRSGSRCHKSVV
ncbi:hypothetical protein DNHGIG_20310 [Collibacillus ludicampi]|uniref:Uncharacterized protein n=1 Tax=Collibacillus ludicampi TaxID=2771369 RepID=A0AAV4LG89_9BACL|nr:hypothetical protein DNHGIG_20310 [Collibacillus ludicampi]